MKKPTVSNSQILIDEIKYYLYIYSSSNYILSFLFIKSIFVFYPDLFFFGNVIQAINK